MPHLLSRLIPLLLILALAVPVLATEPAVTFTATFFDAVTNKPVADVALAFRPQEGDAPPKARSTGPDGRLELALATGDYWLQLSKPGYADSQTTVRIKAGSSRVEQQFTLAPEAVLTGRVVNGANVPLAGVTVRAEGRQATTDSGGTFRLGRLAAGFRRLELADERLMLAREVEPHLTMGTTATLGDLVAVPGVRARITLVDKNDQPLRQLAGMQLNLYGPARHGRGIVDQNGVVTLPPLPPGAYSVETYDERVKRLVNARIELKQQEEPLTLRLPLQLRGPELEFVDDYHDTVVAGKPLKLKIKGIAVKQAKLTLQAVDLPRLLRQGIDPAAAKEIPPALLKPVKQLSITFAGKDGKQRLTRTVTLPKLAPGYYQLVVREGGAIARTRVLVTGLALVTKTATSESLLFATDLRSGKALAKVEIRGYAIGAPTDAKATLTASTDRDGLAQIKAVTVPTILLAQWQGHQALLRLGSTEGSQSHDYQTYLHTDRPAYRPGQTVYFKGIARKRLGDGFALPAMAKLTMTLVDPNDQTVFRQEYTPDQLGSVAGEIALAETPALGDYTLTATSGAENWSTRFKVLAYRKPEFEVKATANELYVIGGDPATVTVRARYYFGAPVAEGTVRYRLYSRPSYYDSDDSSTYYAPDGGYADLISEGEATTDDNGEATLTIPTITVTSPQEYQVELEVQDQASRQVTASTSFMVVPSRVAVQLRQERWFIAPGEILPFTVTTAAYEGTPLATPLTVEIAELRHDQNGPMASLQWTETLTLASDATGTARFEYAFPQPGTWRVTVTAKDSAGRPATTNREFWVWREGASWYTDFRELELTLDKKSYRPGETARLVVRSPGTGGHLLLTQEGREVYHRSVHPLSSKVTVIDIPVTTEQAPYVFISGSTVLQGRFYSTTNSLKVDHDRQQLKVSVTPDKAHYAPGDTVRLTVVANGSDGQGRAADLSLGVVDEAIYAIAPEQHGEIHHFFHGQRQHLVQTIHSFPRVYLAGAAKGEAAPQADALAGIKVRKVFKDTAFWLPFVSTDASGKGTAEFQLPDNLTTWRTTAIGQTAASEFGSGRASFLARLDVMARLQPPRYLVAGDQVVLPSIITNMTAEERPVSGRLEIAGLNVDGETTFSATLPANGTLRRDLTVAATTPGEATMALKALAGDRGDAMELSLPVLANAVNRSASGTILLKEGAGETTVTLPPQALAAGTSLELTLAPNVAASLGDGVAELAEFPYGCVEQTMSRFLPAAYVGQMAKNRTLTLEPSLAAKLPKVLAQGLQRLYDFQHEDGGWGWWRDDQTDLRMTATVVYGLALVRDAGVAVRPEVLQQGVKSLEAMLAADHVPDLSFAYRALTRAGGRSNTVEERLDREWPQLPPSGRVQYLEALVNSGNAAKAKPLLTALRAQTGREGSAVFLRDKEQDDWWWSERWASTPVEASAMLLDTVLRLDRHDPLADGLAEFLLRRRTGRWWQTTRATALAIKSLADYTGEAGSYRATLTLNGRELARYTVTAGQLTAGPARLTLPAKELQTGPNSLRLVKEGDKGSALVSALLRYQVPTGQPATAPGLTISRNLFQLETLKTTNGSLQQLRLPVKPGDPVPVGARLVMELTISNDQPLEYVIIEDPLPAGAEVREQRSPDEVQEMEEYTPYDRETHRERHDNRMAIFVKELAAGQHLYSYEFTPELAGTVQALPAAIWPMYQPALRAESLPLTLKVQP